MLKTAVTWSEAICRMIAIEIKTLHLWICIIEVGMTRRRTITKYWYSNIICRIMSKLLAVKTPFFFWTSFLPCFGISCLFFYFYNTFFKKSFSWFLSPRHIKIDPWSFLVSILLNHLICVIFKALLLSLTLSFALSATRPVLTSRIALPRARLTLTKKLRGDCIFAYEK